MCHNSFLISTSLLSTLKNGFVPHSYTGGALDKYRRVLRVTLCPLRRGWVYRPAPEAPRKGECRRGQRHFWNRLSHWRSRLAVIACRTVRSGVFHHCLHHLWPQGAVPSALTLFGGVVLIARFPEKGNADGLRGIFGTDCRAGLRPCDRTHLKNGLVPHSYAGGA